MHRPPRTVTQPLTHANRPSYYHSPFSPSSLLLSQRLLRSLFFFFNDTAPPEIYPLSLHDALPISMPGVGARIVRSSESPARRAASNSPALTSNLTATTASRARSEGRRSSRFAVAISPSEIGRAHV